MSTNSSSLEEWIREQYHIIGFNAEGKFIGKKKFKNRLLELYSAGVTKKGMKASKSKIRELVNKNVYLPLSPLNVTAQSSSQTLEAPSSKTISPTIVANNGTTKLQTQSDSGLGTDRFESSQEYISNCTHPFSLQVKSMQCSSDQNSPAIAKQEQQPLSGGKGKEVARDSSTLKTPSTCIQERPDPALGNTKSAHETSEVIMYLPGKQPVEQAPIVQAPLNVKFLELRAFVEGSSSYDTGLQNLNDLKTEIPALDEQRHLLDVDDELTDSSGGEGITNSDVKNAVIFSVDVLKQYNPGLLPQYGLLGSAKHMKEICSTDRFDNRLFLNTNIPFSAFICGVQGSGKSHTMSCLIENCLISAPNLGVLHKPLSALVFHFGQYTSHLSFHASEAAFLAYPNPQVPNHPNVASVNVLVAPSNFHNLRALYTQIPGINVRPFKLRPRDLNIGSMLTLMSVDQHQNPPLYMGHVTKILRDMASVSTGYFDYAKFKQQLGEKRFMRMQTGPLNQRLELLESFLTFEDSVTSWNFEAGSITIVDLSCPFVDANTACVLFNICLSMYIESDPTTGKIIAVDEAHKYMTETPASKALADSLQTVIRQQRHYGARVIISTQEPTLSPRFMDLCSTTIIHRFSSPEWFSVLRRHVSIMDDEGNGGSSTQLFKKIISLRVGEALVFAPSAIVSGCAKVEDSAPVKLGSGFLKVKVRKRVTWDGGKSIVCL